MERRAEKFNEIYPASKEAYAQGAPRRLKMHQSSVEREIQATQDAVDDLVMQRQALHVGCGGCTVKKTRNVVCIRLGYKFVVKVPSLVSGCGEQWTVHPYLVGYAPTTPTDSCETWVGMKEVMTFKDMSYANGLSASGEQLDV